MGVVRHSVGVLLHRSTPSDLVIGVPTHDPGIIPLLCADLRSHPAAVSLEVRMEHVREAAGEFHIVEKIGFVVRLAPGERLAHLDHAGAGEATAHKTLRRGIPCGNRIEVPFKKSTGDIFCPPGAILAVFRLKRTGVGRISERRAGIARHPRGAVVRGEEKTMAARRDKSPYALLALFYAEKSRGPRNRSRVTAQTFKFRIGATQPQTGCAQQQEKHYLTHLYLPIPSTAVVSAPVTFCTDTSGRSPQYRTSGADAPLMTTLVTARVRTLTAEITSG